MACEATLSAAPSTCAREGVWKTGAIDGTIAAGGGNDGNSGSGSVALAACAPRTFSGGAEGVGCLGVVGVPLPMETEPGDANIACVIFGSANVIPLPDLVIDEGVVAAVGASGGGFAGRMMFGGCCPGGVLYVIVLLLPIS